uniref:Uncharacterized protein n=2 Tax=Arion vulgaris TaxID=1028688 RepID=A0A0B7AMW3_9EUPU
MFNGLERHTDIERYVLFLNISFLPDDFDVAVCPNMIERSQNCLQFHNPDQTTLVHTFDFRLHDEVYVYFLTTATLSVCENLPKYIELKSCITPQLQSDLQKCIHKTGYDSKCLNEKFDANDDDCSDNAKYIYSDFVNNYLIKNPYNRFQPTR